MRKVIYKYIIWLLVLISSVTKVLAQSNVTTLTANVTRTSHNELIVKDVITKGHFYFQYPDKICMTFNNREDMLLMNGTTYIMMNNGKKNVAKGKIQEMFGVLQNVLLAVIYQNPIPITYENPNIEVSQEGQTIRITSDSKSWKRIPIKSFELILDTSTHKLKTLRINEKGENYVVYNLSGHIQNVSLDTAVFNLN